jgi:putative membrane protein
MKASLTAALGLGLGLATMPMMAQAQSASEKSFVADALAGDMAEVQMGQLAAQKASSPDVKSYGEMLATDHSKAMDEMKTVAGTLGVQPPAGPKADARKEMDRLSKLDGQAFDREFLKHMVSDHEKDVAKFKKEAAGSSQVAQTAKAQLPVLEKHLQKAQELSKSARS